MALPDDRVRSAHRRFGVELGVAAVQNDVRDRGGEGSLVKVNLAPFLSLILGLVFDVRHRLSQPLLTLQRLKNSSGQFLLTEDPN